LAARRIAGNWVFLYGGAVLAAWDLFLDPLMVGAGRWTWEVPGAHVPFTPDIPLSNVFGWFLISFFRKSVARKRLLLRPLMLSCSGLYLADSLETFSSLIAQG
jgi:uncharacterized membrane protein